MLAYLDTSIFDSPAQAIVNTVNTVGVMGKGIALSFKTIYPAMYEEYRRLCEVRKLDIGKLHVYRTLNKIIVNLPTKKHWRNPSRPEYIEAGLKAFVKHYGDYGISSVSFPQLGCGNGELNWKKQVQPLMEKHLRNLPIPVYIHLYARKPNFVPERLDANYAKEVLRERRRISSSELWQDLAALTGEGVGNSKQLGQFGPLAWVDDKFMHFQPDERAEIIFRRNAEVLVPHRLDLAPALKFTACRSLQRDELFFTCYRRAREKKWEKLIRIDTHGLYERKWTFVEEVITVSESRRVLIRFNPGTITPGPFHF